MRLKCCFVSMLLLTAPVAAYGSRATGADWAADYYGHPDHQGWVKEWTGDHISPSGVMLDTCLDHITAGDEEWKAPHNVARVQLTELTAWCLSTIAPGLKDPELFKGKTFRYPDGMVPLSD